MPCRSYPEWVNEMSFQSERAAQKASIMQIATIYTVLGGTLLHIGVTISNQGIPDIANGSFIGAGEYFADLTGPLALIQTHQESAYNIMFTPLTEYWV